mgnify:FL=1
MKFLVLTLILGMCGCGDKEPSQFTLIEVTGTNCEISAREDGWMYVTNVSKGEDWLRFRVKGKHTTWDDFDVDVPPFK